MGSESVKLLGFWPSPFALRVHVALKAKGVEYEYVEEDLQNKSTSVLEYNPVHKKIPILVHNGRPVVESLLIMEYIDETWPHNHPLLPRHPNDRALARFWTKSVDDKCIPAMIKILAKDGKERDTAAGEARECLKALEGGLGGNRFFSGETIGFVDIAAGWLGLWARMVERVRDVRLVEPETMPLLSAWFDRCLDVPIFKESLPPRDDLLVYITKLSENLSARSA